MRCVICGGNDFIEQEVIWDQLAAEWELSPAERQYVDRQQGTQCCKCLCNIRSQALARAIMSHWSFTGMFQDFLDEHPAIGILEINEAAQLTHLLSKHPGRTFAKYPEVDMHSLPYLDGSFDLVVHSDTLEHIEDPVRGLSECRRVLRQDGLLAFTVPTIVDRMTRSRFGMPNSYHGNSTVDADDFKVFTEYGADAWRQVIAAGFEDVRICTFEFPAGIALAASR